MKARLFGKYRKGSSTLEILIAFAVLALTLTAVISVVFGNQSVAVDTQTDNEALYKAEAQLEAVRALSRADFASVQTTPPVVDDIYTKSLTVQTINSSTKLATSLVSWTSGGRSLSVELTTTLTDWFHPGSKCSPVLTGDWTAPQVLGSGDFPSPTGTSGLDVHGSKAYVVSDPTSSSTDDFYIFDVNNPSPSKGTLPIVSEFNTDPINNRNKLSDVKVLGTYAYVAVESATYQLAVIDVSDSKNLDATKIKKLDLTVSNDSAVGKTLAYDNKKIYLGTTISSKNRPEFHIIDVSDPTAPKEIGSGYKVGAGINQIIIQNNLAYLATASTSQIIILDVSDPLKPVVKQTYSSNSVLIGQSVALTGSALFFGRDGGGKNPAGNSYLMSLDPNNIAGAANWAIPYKKNDDATHLADGVYRALVRGNLLFLTTDATGAGSLQLWDMSNPAGAPTRYDTSPLNIQQTSTTGVDCFGNLLYIGERSQHAFQIIGPS